MIMDILDNKFYTIVFFLAGIAIFFYGFKQIRRKRMVENMPTSAIRGLAMGLVEIAGTAQAITKTGEPLKSPVTQAECAYYHYTVEMLEPVGKHAKWQKVAESDTNEFPFMVSDATGKVPVAPEGAEFYLSVSHRYLKEHDKPLPPHLQSFAEKHGLECYSACHLLFKEWHIRQGQEVYVLGTAQKARGIPKAAAGEHPDAARQGEPSDILIGKGPEEKLFIISDKDQKGLAGQLSFEAKLWIVGGAVLSLYTLWSLILFIRLYY